jgi:hypothetical protein
VMGPSPCLILAMAQLRAGQKKQARQTLATAIVGFDWSAAQADSRGVWIVHILRREAEALILPDLPAFLRGEYQPLDNDERLALVGICQFQGRSHAAARLYADAFASDPGLANRLIAISRSRAVLGDKQPVSRVEDLATECRYPAARCAALAGCGPGDDAGKLDAAERARWRKQAREWLRADLTVWVKMLDGGSPTWRGCANRVHLINYPRRNKRSAWRFGKKSRPCSIAPSVPGERRRLRSAPRRERQHPQHEHDGHDDKPADELGLEPWTAKSPSPGVGLPREDRRARMALVPGQPAGCAAVEAMELEQEHRRDEDRDRDQEKWQVGPSQRLAQQSDPGQPSKERQKRVGDQPLIRVDRFSRV